MNARTRFLLPALALAAAALPACSGSLSFVLGEEGSGVAETTSYDFDGFDGVEINNAFQAEIEIIDGPPTVEITVDDNFTDDLEVNVRDGTLDIGFDFRTFQAKITPTVIITVPSLDHVDATGASEIAVTGTLSEPDLRLDASGASHVRADVDTDNLSIDASGASRVTVTGRASRLVLDASGASRIDLDDAIASTGTVDASGASTISIGEAADIDGDLSGASTLRVPGSAVDQIDTSGASEIDRR